MMKPADRILLQLLKAAINAENPATDLKMSDAGWRAIYGQAVRQGVQAVVWEHVRRMPLELQPARVLRLQWACGADRVAARSQRQMREATLLAARCAEAGCKMVLLKGIGLSRYYPAPFFRECGDVDFFLPEGFDRGNEIAAACGMKVSGLDYKHNHIHSNGVVFENHRYLTSFKGKSDVRRLEKTLQDAVANGEFLPLGDTGFYTLSPTINALFITYHGFFHFLIEGITLRHLLDWALFVKAERDAINWDYFYRICDDLHFTRFANTMNAIAEDVFGISLAGSAAITDRRFVERVLDDVVAERRQVSGLPIYKRRLLLVCNMLSSRWKYRLLYGRSFLGEMTRSTCGVLFDRSPELD